MIRLLLILFLSILLVGCVNIGDSNSGDIDIDTNNGVANYANHTIYQVMIGKDGKELECLADYSNAGNGLTCNWDKYNED